MVTEGQFFRSSLRQILGTAAINIAHNIAHQPNSRVDITAKSVGPSSIETARRTPEASETGIGGHQYNRQAEHGSGPISQGDRELTESERREIAALEKRDREVRAHEQAHLAAAGGYARGGAQFEYEIGPDGKRYAVGGEVPIDVSKVPDDPEATLRKAQTVRRAALAPENPSGADRAIAARAASMAAEAHRDLIEKGSTFDIYT